MSGHQDFTRLGQFPQQTNPNARRLLRVVFETVMPIGMLKSDSEHRVASEHQALAAYRGKSSATAMMGDNDLIMMTLQGEMLTTMRKKCGRPRLSFLLRP